MELDWKSNWRVEFNYKTKIREELASQYIFAVLLKAGTRKRKYNFVQIYH